MRDPRRTAQGLLLAALACVPAGCGGEERSASAAQLRQAPAAPAPEPRGRNPFWFDARDYGLSPKNPDNGPALQAAHDAAAEALDASWRGFYSGVRPRATVYIPGARSYYTVKTPVFIESPGVEVRGDGPSSQLLSAPGSGGSTLLYCGINRTGPTNLPGANYRPDLFGKLDRTVVTATRQKWGMRTNTDAYVVAQAGSFSHGGPSPTWGMPDSWRETRQFTVEFAVEGFAGGQMPGNASLCGVGTTGYSAQSPAWGACPWTVTTTATNAYRLNLSTQSVRFGPLGGPYTFDFTSGVATGVQRVAIQVDAAAGLVTAFVNGVQVAVANPNGPLPPGSTLNENQILPFCVNSSGDGSPGGTADFALYGLCVSRSIRYANGGPGRLQVAHPQLSGTANSGAGVTLTLPGSPTGGSYSLTYGGVTSAPIPATAGAAAIQSALQAMSSIGAGNITVSGGTDSGSGIEFQVATANGFSFVAAPGQCDGSNLGGVSIKDVYRFYPAPGGYPFNRDAYALGFLGFTENPATAPRHLLIQGGDLVHGVTCSALLLNSDSNNTIASGNVFKDVVLSSGGPYGVPLVLGHVIDTTIEGVSARGGTYGACNFPTGANYVVRIRDSQFTGGDSGYMSISSIVQMDNINFPVNNRCAIRSYASSIKAKHLIVGNYGSDPVAFAWLGTGTYAGDYSFEDISLDLEGGSGMALGLFYCEAMAYSDTTLKVSDVYGGQIGSVPIFKLRCQGSPPVWPAARLDAESVHADTIGGVVDSDGSLWRGEVRDSVGDYGPYVWGARTSGRPRVVVVDDQSMTFPRWASWVAGTTRVKVPGPTDGQYQEFRVVADGVHGSMAPPRWAGLNAVQADPDASLAAYALGHTSISTTLSGHASTYGHLTTDARATLTAALFGGKATAQPATWYVALQTTPADPRGVRYAEPAAYARAPIANTAANFGPSSGGSKASSAAIAFPAATVPFAARSIAFFRTPTGGVASTVIQLESPLAVTPGMTPTIPAGALTFTRTPYKGDFAGGMTDYGWGRVYDSMFGGIALAPPQCWYVALKTESASEPGNGHHRLPVVAAPENWLVSQSNDFYGQHGDVRNAVPIAFASPTGPWTRCVGVRLLDAANDGNAWFLARLVNPVSPDAGTAPTTFAPGAFTLAVE